MVGVLRFVGSVILVGGARFHVARAIPETAEAGFPALIDATIDDIRAGLEAGLFSSVDLVTVGTF